MQFWCFYGWLTVPWTKKFHSKSPGDPINGTLGKHQTRLSFSLELITDSYSPSSPGFEPRIWNRKAIRQCGLSPRVPTEENSNSVILISLSVWLWVTHSTCAFHLETSSLDPRRDCRYVLILNSICAQNSNPMLPTVRLTKSLEVCAWKL